MQQQYSTEIFSFVNSCNAYTMSLCHYGGAINQNLITDTILTQNTVQARENAVNK